MSRMRNAAKTSALVIVLVLVFGGGLIYGLFHGYFDHGQFEIKQTQWSSAKQVAMVVERSDWQATLSGTTYFVLIGDHVFSPSELRRRYHSSAVVFAAADSCLTLRWQGPTTLVVSCNGPAVTRDHIDVENHRSGGIDIRYENIPTQ